MSIEVIVISVFVGIPVLVGFFVGLASIVSSSQGVNPHATPAWRYVDPSKEIQQKQKELQHDPHNRKEEKAIFELMEEAKPSHQPTVAYENSEPSVEMNRAIDELLTAIGGPVQESQPNVNTVEQPVVTLSEVEQLLSMSTQVNPETNAVDEPLEGEAIDWSEEFKDVQIAATAEPEFEVELAKPVVSEKPIEVEEPVKENSEQLDNLDNLVPFPIDYIPSPLASDDYRAIVRRYGSVVAQAITTTPGQGSTGKSDVMIGRLEQNSVGYVLSYNDSFIPLKGDVPKQYIGKAVLLLGQFVSQEEFYVLEWDDPEAIAHNLTAPFFESGSQLMVSM